MIHIKKYMRMQNKIQLPLIVMVFICSLSICLVRVQAQSKPYHLKGLIENASNVYIYLQPGFGANYGDKDSVFSKDGTFSFKGSVSAPKLMSLYVQGQRMGFAFILEPGELIFQGKSNDMNNASIQGGEQNKIYNQYRELLKERRKEYTQLMDTLKIYREHGDSITYNTYQEKWKNWGEQQRIADEKFIQKHPASFTALIICRSILGAPELVLKWLAQLDQSLHTNIIYKEVKFRAEVDMRVGMGKTAPDFKQKQQNRKPFQLSSLKGKYVLLDFWASWCIPCRKQSPQLVKLYQKFASHGFEIVSISLDSEKTAWTEAITKDQYTWINISDLKGYNAEVAALYGVTLIPRNFLLDKEGKIIAMDLKPDALEKKLAELLQSFH
jgi:peroxiredoxin